MPKPAVLVEKYNIPPTAHNNRATQEQSKKILSSISNQISWNGVVLCDIRVTFWVLQGLIIYRKYIPGVQIS